jgi:hypothetical protein
MEIRLKFLAKYLCFCRQQDVVGKRSEYRNLMRICQYRRQPVILDVREIITGQWILKEKDRVVWSGLMGYVKKTSGVMIWEGYWIYGFYTASRNPFPRNHQLLQLYFGPCNQLDYKQQAVYCVKWVFSSVFISRITVYLVFKVDFL